MAILYLTTDLFFSSQITGAANARGERIALIAAPLELITRAGNRDAELVIVDLSTPGLDIANLVAGLRELKNPPRAIIAYDAHVRVAALKSARQAGCDAVLTRGQLHGELENVLDAYLGDS